MSANRNLATVKFGPLLALVAAAIGIALYQWKSAPIERQLSAKIVGFEVTRDSDEARNPPIRESLAATVTFANGGAETESISRVRFLVSSKEDLSIPRSWSTTSHRDSMLLDVKIPPGDSMTHTFIIPWTGREEARYFPDGSKIQLGFSISANTPDGETVTRTHRFGYVVQRDGLIAESDHQLLVIAFPTE
jgi:hypothetical protein